MAHAPSGLPQPVSVFQRLADVGVGQRLGDIVGEDHADEAVSVDHRQAADLVLGHGVQGLAGVVVGAMTRQEPPGAVAGLQFALPCH